MEYNPEEFQKTMQKLMGSRSMAEFAAMCGISRANLSKVMSAEHPAQPGKNTLRKIADHTELDYEDLLMMCGYAESPAAARKQRPFMDRIRMNARDMEEGFGKLAGRTCLFDDIREFLETYRMLYSYEDCKFAVSKPKEYEGERRNRAEKYVNVFAMFKDMESVCYTYAVIYYAETKGGSIVILDTAMDGKALMESHFASEEDLRNMRLDPEDVKNMEYVYYIRETSEGRLLRKLFGEETTWYRTVISGFGFCIDGDTPKFRDFVRNHMQSLPDEASTLQAYLDDSQADADQFFRQYMHGNSASGGRTAVIADIMAAETGIPFCGFADTEESDFPPCVMVEETEDAYRNADLETLKDIVRKYAAELGLKEYGNCMANSVICADENMRFKVEEDER